MFDDKEIFETLTEEKKRYTLTEKKKKIPMPDGWNPSKGDYRRPGEFSNKHLERIEVKRRVQRTLRFVFVLGVTLTAAYFLAQFLHSF